MTEDSATVFCCPKLLSDTPTAPTVTALHLTAVCYQNGLYVMYTNMNPDAREGEKPRGDWGNSRLSRLRRSCARLDKTAMLRRLARWGKCLSVQISLLWNIDARMISILLHMVSATLWKDKVTSVCHDQYQCQYSPKGAKLQTCWVARPRSRSSLNISADQ